MTTTHQKQLRNFLPGSLKNPTQELMIEIKTGRNKNPDFLCVHYLNYPPNRTYSNIKEKFGFERRRDTMQFDSDRTLLIQSS